jgi:hypothetical protein
MVFQFSKLEALVLGSNDDKNETERNVSTRRLHFPNAELFSYRKKRQLSNFT